MIKKILAIILSGILLAVSLSGCNNEPSTNTNSISSIPSSGEENSSSEAQSCNKENNSSAVQKEISSEIDETTHDRFKRVPFDPSNEPPLSKRYTKKIPVPDFLDKKQQNLYRRAMGTASFMFIETSNIDDYYYYYPLQPGQKARNPEERFQPIEETDRYYCYISDGRYQKWNDFETMILSIFTKDCFNKLNNPTKDKRFSPHFRPYKEMLCYINLDWGTNSCISGVPDSFELISQTNNKIKFNVIGHYFKSTDAKKGETEEERQKRIKTTYDYTKAFPITMVKTENGWRFSEFNITI